MRISTEIDAVASLIGEEKTIEYLAKAGFDAWDFSMFAMCRWNWDTDAPYDTPHPLKESNYLAFAKRLKQVGQDNGIVCNQSHAPFPSGKPIMYDYLLRAIECTAEAGGKICVIHPDTYATIEENVWRNAELYNRLLPFAKAHGVKIATENMWAWNKEKDRADFAACATAENFNAVLDAVNDESLVACLDIGHAEMMGDMANAVELIYALGPRLQALHIHDNDKHRDLHQIPFSMKIDFQAVAKALKEISYQGDFTMEAPTYFTDYTAENVYDGVKALAKSAKKFKELFASIV